ncbi:MAG: flippase [Oscillatoriaceae cyanobacterium]
MKIWKFIPNTRQGSTKNDIFSFLLRGAGTAFVMQVFGVGLSYIIQVLLARWMGAVEYGTYNYVLAWTVLLAIPAGLGFPTTVLRFIPEYITKSEWGRLHGVIRASRQLCMLTSLALSLLGTVVVFWLETYKNLPYSRPLLLGFWMIPLQVATTLESGMAKAVSRIDLSYVPTLVQPVLIAGCGFFLVQKNPNLTTVPVMGATILTLLAVLVIQLWLFHPVLPLKVYQTSPVYENREWLRVSLPLLLIAGFVLLLNQTDILMIGALRGTQEVGIYKAATKVASLVNIILIAVNTVAAPIFSSLYAEGKREDLQKMAGVVVHWIFWPSLVINLILIIFGKQILSVFGSEFNAAYLEMVILAIGQLVNAGTGSVGFLLNMTGHQNKSAYVYGSSCLINMLLNAITIPAYGSVGAAASTATTMIFWNIWLHSLVEKNIGVKSSIVDSLVFYLKSKKS